MKNKRQYYIVLLLCFVTLLIGQNASEIRTSPVGLYYYDTHDGPFRTGYNYVELKEFPIAINWSDGKIGDPQSNLGSWRLNGDTITIFFYTYTFNFIWHKGYDKDPNFYSKLEQLTSGEFYYRVSHEKLTTDPIVNNFAVKGKAIKKKGIPMLEVILSDTIYLHIDNLPSWRKEYLNKFILVHGILEEGVDNKMVMTKWTITKLD